MPRPQCAQRGSVGLLLLLLLLLVLLDAQGRSPAQQR
jgi:hypothetical protein